MNTKMNECFNIGQENYYYVFDSGSSANHQMFSDVSKMKNAKLYSWGYDISNIFLRKLNKFHMSPKVNMMVKLPYQEIWNRYSVIDLKEDLDTVNWVILTNFSARRFPANYLNNIKNNNGVRLVLLYLDPLSTLPKFYRQHLEKIEFDLVYSFDKEDCKKYGWIYTNCLYSMVEIESDGQLINDVYFVGLDKGRDQLIRKVYDWLVAHGVKCDFHVVSEDKTESDNRNGLQYHRSRIGYSDVLEGISRSKCVLEILQEGQVGMTMRPYEALFYNKLLITNNAKIIEMPFYNDSYMKIFCQAEDIDCSFLLQTGEVDYKYNGEYSPIYWLNQLENDYFARS